MYTPAGQLMLEETFAGDGLGDGWAHVRTPSFCADDGVVETSADGLHVAPGARNQRTGEPAFTKLGGGLDAHLKWLVTTTTAFPTQGGALRVSFRARARAFGVDRHPFGPEAVPDARSDLRLGAATLNVLDFATGMVFDFWLTETAIYPYYERLRLPGLHGDHEAFGATMDPVVIEPDTEHDLTITVDAAAGSAAWEVDGHEVARVAQLGPCAPGWRCILHHGGAPTPAAPTHLQVGMGLMTLLDAALVTPDEGLVDLGTSYEPARSFCGGPQLWGQGVELRVRRVVVARV